ncbi:hypothetical protein DMUE_4871 [Dictyocoela muelleri]|nr:hypothetical protein DMUE_4871 [Dictyocoela muelleri]
MGLNDLQVIAKAEEAFYTGLSNRTKVEMSKLNIKTIIGIYEIINCKEETLMVQMSINEPYVNKDKNIQRLTIISSRKRNVHSMDYVIILTLNAQPLKSSRVRPQLACRRVEAQLAKFLKSDNSPILLKKFLRPIKCCLFF